MRVVATTHSPQLKALSFNDKKFDCATVLLDGSGDSFRTFKLPTFKLAYGSIGDSYALGAASRCQPMLPDEVLERAVDILAGEKAGSGSILIALESSMQREKEAAQIAARKAEDMQKDVLARRGAIVALAQAHEEHLLRLENRLDTIFKDLMMDDSKNAYDVVGETLAELRHVKKRVKSEKELLAERGLKMVPAEYTFSDGEIIVIISKGEWEGQTGVVSIGKKDTNSRVEEVKNDVFVIPSYHWDTDITQKNVALSDSMLAPSLKLKRNEIALWDYASESILGDDVTLRTKTVSDSKQKLFDVLAKLKPEESNSSGNISKQISQPNPYKSSRERRAAMSKKTKRKKQKKR